MDMIISFDKEEYEKIIQLLGLRDNQDQELEDDTDYFNAWNFGQTEDDYQFLTYPSTEIPKQEYCV